MIQEGAYLRSQHQAVEKTILISGLFLQETLTKLEVGITASPTLNDEFGWDSRVIIHNTRRLTNLS